VARLFVGVEGAAQVAVLARDGGHSARKYRLLKLGTAGKAKSKAAATFYAGGTGRTVN
jgi:hypothetical protein